MHVNMRPGRVKKRTGPSAAGAHLRIQRHGGRAVRRRGRGLQPQAPLLRALPLLVLRAARRAPHACCQTLTLYSKPLHTHSARHCRRVRSGSQSGRCKCSSQTSACLSPPASACSWHGLCARATASGAPPGTAAAHVQDKQHCCAPPGRPCEGALLACRAGQQRAHRRQPAARAA